MGTLGESRRVRVAFMMLADALMVVAAGSLAYFARFEGVVPARFLVHLPEAMVVSVGVFIVSMWIFGMYHVVLRYIGVQEILRLVGAVMMSSMVLAGFDILARRVIGYRPVPLGVIPIMSSFAFLALASLRSVGRLWIVLSRPNASGGRRVLIVGAGDAGSLLLRDIENQPQLGYQVVGFLDDKLQKRNLKVRNAPILGPIEEVTRWASKLEVDEIMIAIPSLSDSRRREVLGLCTRAGLPTRMIPGIVSYATSPGVADLRPVAIEDLLGRPTNEIDVDLIAGTLMGKVVAVTGAAGSIGSELCRQIMRMAPRQLLLLEIDESRLYELYLEMEEIRPGVAVMRIADVRDGAKLMRIFREELPEVVFHAAAYKHVPIMEAEPDEAVRANVLGTLNVLKSCAEVGADRFVLISTDKAVEPRNVMGATKALAERVMLLAASHGVRAVAVRFGNVLGSRGSVIPIFEEQLRRGGPIKVTHPEVTRYFMTIPEAARLVLQAQAMSGGGDIFVLDMGEPVRIIDLAQRMIALSGVHTHIEYTGLRPGEKLHEILVHEEVDLVPTGCPVVRSLSALPRIQPEFVEGLSDLLACAGQGNGTRVKDLLERMADAQLGLPLAPLSDPGGRRSIGES